MQRRLIREDGVMKYEIAILNALVPFAPLAQSELTVAPWVVLFGIVQWTIAF
jgi:hypothetical protein